MRNRLKKNYIYMYLYIYMPLLHFVLFKTTLRKTFWPNMKILSKNTSLLPPESMIPPFHILFTSSPTLISFIPLFFTSFIYILLYFASFRFYCFGNYVFLFFIYLFLLINILFDADFKNAICFWRSHLVFE